MKNPDTVPDVLLLIGPLGTIASSENSKNLPIMMSWTIITHRELKLSGFRIKPHSGYQMIKFL